MIFVEVGTYENGRRGPILNKDTFVTATSARNKIRARIERGARFNRIIVGMDGFLIGSEKDRING